MLRHYVSVAALTFRKSPIVVIANITVLALGLTAFVATYAATATPLLNGGGLPLARSADEGAPQRLAAEHGVSYDFAAVLDLDLLAGRFFERERADEGRDAARDGQDIVIDRKLAEFFGFATPADAIGEVVYVPKDFLTSFGLGTAARPMQIIGVVENKPLAIGGGVHPGAVYRLGTELWYTIVQVSRDDVAGARRCQRASISSIAPATSSRETCTIVYQSSVPSLYTAPG